MPNTSPDFIPDTQAENYFGSSPDFIPDNQADSFFNTTPTRPQTPGAFKYDVAEPTITPEQKATNFQNDYANATANADKAAKEAKRSGSFLGILGNTLKGTGEVLASSEIGLGQSIAKVFDKKTVKTASDNISKLTQSQLDTMRMIKEYELQGKDASNLKRVYNNTQDLIDQNKKAIDDYSASIPSKGKVLGQIGGTALDVLTAGTYGSEAKAMETGSLVKPKIPFLTKATTSVGLPEAGKVAGQKASGIFTKKGVANVAKGAGVGYASDVTQGLQGARGEDRTGAEAFIPGIGTAFGSVIPLASETTQSIKNVRNPEIKTQKLVNKRAKELNKLDKNPTISKAVEKGNQRGIDIKKILSETDVLHGSVDNTGTINTKGDGGAVAEYTKKYINGNESLVGDILKKENRSISPALVKSRLKQAVLNAGIEGDALTTALNKIDGEVAGYALRAGETGNIPVETLHKAKINKYDNINFFTEGNTKKYDKTIAKALKQLVEENTTSAEVSKINQELSKHFAVIDYLNKLNGKKVDGGKLGRYFAQTVGGIVGGHFGPLGAIAGAEAGGRIKGNTMSKVFEGKTGKQPVQSKVINDALKVKNAEPLQLPPYSSKSNSFGNLNINQSTTKTTVTNPPKKANISSIVPKNDITVNSKKAEATLPKTVKRDLSLRGNDAKVQEASIKKYESNPEKMVNDYIKQNGKIVNTDEARKLFKDEGYVGTNARAVQEASSAVSKDVFRKLLNDSKGEDALFTVGGSGTGKTSVIKNMFPEEYANAGVILDSNLSKMQSAGDRIQEALNAGKKPNLIYVYRDPIDSWINGVVKRMNNKTNDEGGRIVPLSVFIDNHKGSYNVIKSLLQNPDNGKKFKISLIDNSLGQGNHELLDPKKFGTISYNDNLKEQLLEETKKLYEQGQITKVQYQELIQ
jgi:hypothetical protein